MTIDLKSKPLPLMVRGIKCETFQYAILELTRMLKKANVNTLSSVYSDKTDALPYTIQIGDISNDNFSKSVGEKIKNDGFAIDTQSEGILLIANSAKGVLNAVYELMERLGYLYLFPTDAGEWAPQELAELTEGISIINPRFPHRGVFREEVTASPSHTSEEWFVFFAKLRFNAVVLDRPDLLPLAKKVGLRMELGGHGFSKLLPRELFDEKPELFRMFQPDDFGGRRMADSNLCVTNQKTKRIVQKNFRKKLTESKGAYALHLWADDLPAGGWCQCPSCRAFPPEDQATLAMRILADEAKSIGNDMKIPVLAYHDTMTPGPEVDVSDNMFLLFAPRERCYGHALDDSNCQRNRFYLDALKQWMKKFDGIRDNHTFEYYFDQILFRGMHPYIPEIIAGDMNAYEKHGIECHLSLQVASDSVAPEYNMLFFAASHWDKNDLSPKDFSTHFAERFAEQNIIEAMKRYLDERANIFEKAMQMCEHNFNIYLDYRWLPETNKPFGAEMAATYLEASRKLTNLAEKLASAVENSTSDRIRILIKQELKRLEFESAEFKVMHYQQTSVNQIAKFYNSADETARREAINNMKLAISALEVSLEKAKQCGFSDKGWYIRNINKWLTKEFKQKIDNLLSIEKELL